MISKIESISDFKKIRINVDAIGFLTSIKSVHHEYKIDKHLVCDLHMVKRLFHIASQESRCTQAYLDKFQALINVLEVIGGSIGNNPRLIASVCHQYVLTLSTIHALNELARTKFREDTKNVNTQ